MPEPVIFYPLNSRYKAAEKENRQPQGILGDVSITNGPYNERGGAYMFHGTVSSYIEFRNIGGLDTQSSFTFMCWVQPGGRDGPLFSYGVYHWGVVGIVTSKLFNQIVKSGHHYDLTSIRTPEVLPAGKWVHLAASYDNNTRNNSLYINGHLSFSQIIAADFKIATIETKVRMGTRSDDGKNFKGKIAEMKVYDVALNEAQIQPSMRQGSCTFLEIVVSLPSPMIALINKTFVIGQLHKRWQTPVSGSCFAKQRPVRRQKK